MRCVSAAQNGGSPGRSEMESDSEDEAEMERAGRAVQVAANLQARLSAGATGSGTAAHSHAGRPTYHEGMFQQRDSESFRGGSARIFDRLDEDTWQRRAEAVHRDMDKDREHSKTMLRKQAQLRKARQEFEASTQVPDEPVEMVSWRHRFEADARVINGFGTPKTAKLGLTVPERDDFLDRMASDVGERLKDGRGIHTLTEQAPCVETTALAVAGTLRWRRRALATSPRQRAVLSSRRLKSPAPNTSRPPTSPKLVDAALRLQRVQRGMSERQRLAQGMAAEMEALETMVLRGEGDRDDYDRLLQLHRWAKLQHDKPKPPSPQPKSPPATPPNALKPFVPAHNTDGETYNVVHMTPEPQKPRAASPPTKRTPSPEKRSPASPPPRIPSPIGLSDYNRRRAPHAFAVLQHENAEHHEHHEISSATDTHAVHNVGKGNQTTLLSYISPGREQTSLTKPRPINLNLHGLGSEERGEMLRQTGELLPVTVSGLEQKVQNLRTENQQTLDEGVPQHKVVEMVQTAVTGSIDSQTRLLSMSMSKHQLETVETSSGDETDTESETDGVEGERVLYEGDVHLCVPAGSENRWVAVQMQLIRSMANHWTKPADRLQWRPSKVSASQSVQRSNDEMGEASEAGWVTRPVQSIRLWRELGLAGHPLPPAVKSLPRTRVSTGRRQVESIDTDRESDESVRDAYGYTFCIGPGISEPVKTTGTAPAETGARARGRAQRRWSQAGAERRVPEKVSVDGCAEGAPAAATAALRQLYRRLSSKVAVVNAFKTIDAGEGSWRTGRPGALRAPELRKALSLLECPLNAEQIKHVIQAIDQDGDGEVDVREFIDFVWRGRTDLLRRRLESAAYGFGGVDYAKVFHHYDRDNSGALDFDEFRRAVRKDAKVRPNEISDNELRELFDGIDEDCSGTIDIEEFGELLQPTATAAAKASVAAEGETTYSMVRQPTTSSMSMDAVACARRQAETAAAEGRLGTVSGKVLSLLLDHASSRRMNILRVFHRFDVDESGELDHDELLEAMSQLGIVISLADVQQLMRELDSNGSGTVSIAEFWQAVRQTKKDKYILAARDARKIADSSRASGSHWTLDETQGEPRTPQSYGGSGVSDICDRDMIRTMTEDASSGPSSESSNSAVWLISCTKASQQRGWISAISAVSIGTDELIQDSDEKIDSSGPGEALLDGSLQEGMKEVAARRLQAGTRGMLVRHTPEIRLQVALRRAQLRDTELLRPVSPAMDTAQSDVSSESDEPESLDESVFRYTGPDGPHVERIRQNLRACSFGKGELNGHAQDVNTLFERFDTEKNGFLLSRVDFTNMLRRGGKASVQHTRDDVCMTSLRTRVSDDRPGHAAPIELSQDELNEIFEALERSQAGGVEIDRLHAFVWGTS